MHKHNYEALWECSDRYNLGINERAAKKSLALLEVREGSLEKMTPDREEESGKERRHGRVVTGWGDVIVVGNYH